MRLRSRDECRPSSAAVRRARRLVCDGKFLFANVSPFTGFRIVCVSPRSPNAGIFPPQIVDERRDNQTRNYSVLCIGRNYGRWSKKPRVQERGLHDQNQPRTQNPKFNPTGPNPNFKLLVLAGVTFARVASSSEGIPSVRESMFESIP